MELSAKYNPAETEDKWYAWWLENKFFHSEPDEREPYTIVIPPPNVTGILHMGHVLNNTLNDVLVRKARMDGKNACWVPGTDHASIATESKVVAKLKEQGISKEDISREEFLQHAWEWKEKHGGIILSQLRKLGASCDWDRTRFTMDPDLSEAVINTFVYFYDKGYIYRGVRMVNWDPVGLTAVSDEEVIHRDTTSKFYHLRYFISDGNGNPTEDFLTIATTRPETIMADAAICVNPADERYHWLRGKKVLIPLINKEIPVIEDSYVEMDFGTGCLKVTPAHDVNDYEIGLRHNLPVLDIIDDHGRLNEKARILVGEDRFEARRKIEKMLAEAGNLVKVEDYTSPVGYSERTDAVIEPRLSMQWFLKMDALAKDALESVESGRVRLIPDKYRNTYRHWMENVHDWCISRQLWWGQQIPAYYLPDGRYVVAPTAEKALELRLRLMWSGCRKQVKLLIHPGFVPVSRLDGAPGGIAPRICNGEEYPMTDFVSVVSPEGRRFAVASPDVTGVDVQPDGLIRLTLLRSPVYAHHDPFPLPAENDYPVTDQGEHEYRILLLPEAGSPEEIRRMLFPLTDPLWFSECTRGCGFDFH